MRRDGANKQNWKHFVPFAMNQTDCESPQYSEYLLVILCTNAGKGKLGLALYKARCTKAQTQ